MNLTPPNDPMIHQNKYDLTGSLSDHFDDSSYAENLYSTVSLLRDVIKSCAHFSGLPAKFDILLQYAMQAQLLFNITHWEEDIDASITVFVEYADMIPDDHQTWKLSCCFWMTATAMLYHYKHFPPSDTLHEAFTLFEKSSRVPGV